MQQPRQVASPSIVPEFPKEVDYASFYGAGILISLIEGHWRGRGFAGIRVERYEIPVLGIWAIRSNIGPDGFPPRKKALGRKAVLV